MPTATLNSNRPANFVLTTADDDVDDDALGAGGRQQSLLMPGEVRSPGLRPTPLIGDWVRGDTDYWDSGKEESSKQQPSCTPLNSYGREVLWTLPSVEAPAPHTHPHVSDSSSAMPLQTTSSSCSTLVAPHATPHHHHHGHSELEDDMAQIQTTISQAVAALEYSSSSPVTSCYDDHSHMYPPQPSVTSSTASATAPPHLSYHQQLSPSTLLSSSNGGIGMQAGGGFGVGVGGLGSRQSSTDGHALLLKYRSQSEILSDELYHQGKTFPPPPPPNPPGETRRTRAELWYLVARKWDITQQMAPPPRSPLPGMEEERIRDLPELTRVPYRGDRWLAQSDRWFLWVQQHFEYPVTNTLVSLSSEQVFSLIA